MICILKTKTKTKKPKAKQSKAKQNKAEMNWKTEKTEKIYGV